MLYGLHLRMNARSPRAFSNQPTCSYSIPATWNERHSKGYKDNDNSASKLQRWHDQWNDSNWAAELRLTRMDMRSLDAIRQSRSWCLLEFAFR